MKYLVFVFFAFVFPSFAQAIPPLEAYGRLPELVTTSLSPSGKRYAFISSNGDTRKLGVVEGGKIIFLGDFGRAKLRGFQWVGDDRILVEQSTTFDRPLDILQAHELSAYMNIDLRTKTMDPMLGKSRKVANVLFDDVGTRFIDGKSYKYFIGLAMGWDKSRFSQGNGGYFFDGDHRNLYRVDLESGDVTLEARGAGEGPGYDWIVGPDGKVLVHSVYDRTTGDWRLYAGEDNKTLLLQRKITAGLGRVTLQGLGRTPNSVWVLDGSGENVVLEEISLSDGKLETLFADDQPDLFLHDRDTALAIGATLMNEPRGSFFDEKLQARFRGARKAFPDLQMHLLSFSRNFDRLIVYTEGGGDSGTFWLVDIASGGADPIGRSYPEIGGTDVGPVRSFDYKAADGVALSGVLTLPPDRKAEKLPLVIMPLDVPVGLRSSHGFNWWMQAFAVNGYAVFQPEHRGSKIAADGMGQMGAKMQSDLSDSITALAAQGIVDPARVCIAGFNYGGYAALAGVTMQRGIYRCAVSVAGPTDLPAFYKYLIDRYGYDSDATRSWLSVVGAEQNRNGTLQARSPANLAAQASAPVLLIHGRDDTIVPFTQSERMVTALRSTDKPVELIALDGEDHWMSVGETRKAMLKASVEFVQKYNPAN